MSKKLVVGPNGAQLVDLTPEEVAQQQVDADAAAAAAQAAADPNQVYDRLLQQEQLLKAVVQALNDGSLPVGQNLSGSQIKTIIKAKL